MQIQEYIYHAITIHACFHKSQMSVLTHSRSSYSLVASLDAAKNCQPLNITHFFMQHCLIDILVFILLYIETEARFLHFPLLYPDQQMESGPFPKIYILTISNIITPMWQMWPLTQVFCLYFLCWLWLEQYFPLQLVASRETHNGHISIVIVFQSKSKRNCCISDLT